MDEIPKVIGYFATLTGAAMMAIAWIFDNKSIQKEIWALGKHMSIVGAAVFVI